MVKAPLALENWLGWLSLHRMSIPAYLIADSQLICFDFWMFPTTCTFQLEAKSELEASPGGWPPMMKLEKRFCPVDMCCKILVVGILDRLRPWRKW